MKKVSLSRIELMLLRLILMEEGVTLTHLKNLQVMVNELDS